MRRRSCGLGLAGVSLGFLRGLGGRRLDRLGLALFLVAELGFDEREVLRGDLKITESGEHFGIRSDGSIEHVNLDLFDQLDSLRFYFLKHCYTSLMFR